MDNNKLYHYKGPVYKRSYLYDDMLICAWWEADTYATSPKKAINNLMYRFKVINDMDKNILISLTGRLEVED